MAKLNPAKFTAAGLTAAADLFSHSKANKISHISISTTNYNSVDISKLTKLTNEVLVVVPSMISQNENVVTATGIFDSTRISVDSTINSIGLYILDNTGVETLLAVVTASQPDFIPAGGTAQSSIVYEINIALDNPGVVFDLTISDNAMAQMSDITAARAYTDTKFSDVDGRAVHKTGDESISGSKTFLSTIIGSISGLAGTATKLLTGRKIGGVLFDGTADITLPGVNAIGNQSTTGNAATATALQTARSIAISGDATGSASFGGTADAGIVLTLANVTTSKTTSALSTNAGDSLTVVDVVNTDTKGRTTGINTKTVTLPATAPKLTMARTIAATGDVAFSTSFDGSANVSATATLANSGVIAGTYPKVTVDGKGRVTAGTSLSASDIPTLNQSTTGNAATATKVVATVPQVTGTPAKQPIMQITTSANNFANIIVGDNGVIDSGYLEISTGDGGTEPIFVRQYSGGNGATSGTVSHSATLLDNDGTTSFPINVKSPLFTGALSGNASTASLLQAPRALSTTGDVIGTATYFNGGSDISIPTVLAPVTRSSTTSSAAPVSGDAITMVDSVSTDTKGRTTAVNTKTVTLPKDIIGNSATATKLQTARGLAVNLGSLAAQTFDGTEDQKNIPVSGVLPIANGGTGGSNAKAAFDALAFLGTNPASVGSTTLDTVANWVALGTGYAWFNEKLINNQPSKYGFLINIATGSDVAQIFISQTDSQTFHRSGNASGWSFSFRQYFDELTTIPIANGGTGNTTGNAPTASKLLSPANINGVPFDGSAAITVSDTTRMLKSGDTMTGALSINPASGNASVELGAQAAGVASTPFIDFHAGATTVDYDSRIIAKTGTGVAGAGTLEIDAGSLVVTGAITSPTLNGAVNGNATSSTKLQTGRSISLTGDVSYSVTFDGTANVSGTATLANSGVTAGTYPKVTVDAKGRVTSGAALSATDVPTLNQSTTGNAGTATKLQTTRTIGGVTFDGTANINLPGVNIAGNQDTTGNAGTATNQKVVSLVGTENLNTLGPGLYYASTDTIANALSALGSPTTKAFELLVTSNGSNGFVQKLTELVSSDEYIRSTNAGGDIYNSWVTTKTFKTSASIGYGRTVKYTRIGTRVIATLPVVVATVPINTLQVLNEKIPDGYRPSSEFRVTYQTIVSNNASGFRIQGFKPDGTMYVATTSGSATAEDSFSVAWETADPYPSS